MRVILISITAATILAAGCVTSTVDANRGLWHQYLKSTDKRPTADASGRTTKSIEEKAGLSSNEAMGLAILANEVLGREIPANTETESNHCLFGDRSSKKRRGLSSTSPEGQRRDVQDLAQHHVFGNFNKSIGPDGVVRWKATDDGLVPKQLRATKVVQKYTSALIDPDNEAAVESEVELSRGELVAFGRTSFSIAADQEEAGKTSVGRLMRLYLGAYLKGKFVDRSGRLYKKPEIVNSVGGDKPTIEIGTDAIAGFVAVALEALTDAAFGTPVLKKGTVYFTEQNRIPTFAALFGAEQEIQSDPTKPGITELEWRLIQYVSELAGTKSRMISDLVFGLLSEGEVQFIVGAHFAFGDNDTLRVLLDTLFDVSARKITMHLAYKGLAKFTYEIKNGRVVPKGSSNTELGRVISLLLQEQAILKKLLPPDSGT